MAVSCTALTSGGDSSSDTTDYSSASVTIPANTLGLIAIVNNNSPRADPATVKIGATSFTKIATANVATDTTLSLWRVMVGSDATGTIDMHWANSRDNVVWSVVYASGVDTTGVNGAGAVVQSATNTGSGTSTLTVTLAAFGNTNNATFGAFGHEFASGTGTSATPGTGFTELHDKSQVDVPNNFVDSVETEWRVDNDTSVDITWANNGALAGIAIEIKAAAGGATTGAPYFYREHISRAGGY